jgi:4-hydroxy-4-methyl-2-oxoglutarate aldolase
VRVRGPDKAVVGALDEPVEVGGAVVRPGDAIVLDADGVVVVARERAAQVLEAARERADRERVKREKLAAGALSYDLDGLRAVVEGERPR